MTMTRSGRILTILTSATLLAGLVSAAVVTPVSAARPKCDGYTATIVGTARGEVIRGTPRRDVIVAKGGNDRIFGRGGNDLICGGRGNDTIVGNAGRDVAFGEGGRDDMRGGDGNDRLLGGPGNDKFDGGAGFDVCRQDAGSGPRVRCERPLVKADLSISVLGDWDPITPRDFVVTVTNNGPSPTAYSLSHVRGAGLDADCTPTSEPSGAKAILAAGASRDHTYVYDCPTYDYYELTVTVKPAAGTTDPDLGNNTDSDTSKVLI